MKIIIGLYTCEPITANTLPQCLITYTIHTRTIFLYITKATCPALVTDTQTSCIASTIDAWTIIYYSERHKRTVSL